MFCPSEVGCNVGCHSDVIMQLNNTAIAKQVHKESHNSHSEHVKYISKLILFSCHAVLVNTVSQEHLDGISLLFRTEDAVIRFGRSEVKVKVMVTF